MLLEKTLMLDDIEHETPTLIDPNLLLKDDRVSFSDGCIHNGLIEEKYGECTEKFLASLLTEGQKAPALLEKGRSGYYFMNGHHRLAAAIEHGLELLVLIVPTSDPDKSIFEYWDSSESDDFPDSTDY